MKNDGKYFFIAIMVMALWGSLYPFVKIGYNVLCINTKNIPDILVFAGLRFLICGAIITAAALIKGERITARPGKTVLYIITAGLFSTVLQYAFTYIGLTVTAGSKTAILKQLGSLFYVCTAFLFIKEEKFDKYKLTGAIIGFSGIVVINLGSSKFTLALGDIFIIAASFCVVFADIFGKKAMEGVGAFLMTGISEFIGGAVLFLAGIIGGGSMPVFSPRGILVFGYICLASMGSYCLWYVCVRKGSLSGLTLLKFLTPVFSAIFSWLLLSENILKWQYAVSFALIVGGITVARKKSAK